MSPLPNMNIIAVTVHYNAGSYSPAIRELRRKSRILRVLEGERKDKWLNWLQLIRS